MKKRITCPHCHQHYEVEDTEIAGFNEMTCNSCNKDFMIAENIEDVQKEKQEQLQIISKEESQVTSEKDILVKSWNTITGVLSFVIVICIILCVVPLLLSANARDGGVVAACFGASIAVLIVAFNFYIIKVFAKTAIRTLERQNETKEFQTQLLDVIKKLQNKN